MMESDSVRVTDVVREVSLTRIQTARERAMGIVGDDDFSQSKTALDRRREIMKTRMNLINKIIPGRSSSTDSVDTDSRDSNKFPDEIDGVQVEANQGVQPDQEFIELIRERALDPGTADRISFRGDGKGGGYAVIISRSGNRQRVTKRGLRVRNSDKGSSTTRTQSMGDIGGSR